jgi:protein tyrosine/serine phosphatase
MILLGVPVLIALWVGFMNLYGNIRVMDDGKLIRSGQLSEKRFKRLIDKYKVKTVINLRGTENAPHEKRICEEKGIHYFGPSWSSKDLPTPENLRKLIILLEMAEDPCLGGADRSGEVTAIYKLMKGQSKKEALKMLTPWYGHIPFIRPAKRFFIEKAWKGVEWAKNQYKGEL